MPNREKVIAGLTMLTDRTNDNSCEGLKCCKIAEDAIALLNQQENDIHHMGLIIDEYEKELKKNQDAVEPHYNARTNWYECGACHYSMTSGMHCRSELIPAYKVGFCAKCGKAVIWK